MIKKKFCKTGVLLCDLGISGGQHLFLTQFCEIFSGDILFCLEFSRVK